MENILIVLAAGKSSRVGGYPKAFCRLNGQTNVAHTVSLAHQYFSKVYVVVNEETYRSGIPEMPETDIISIVTGQGDADSLLKALTQIWKKEPSIHTVTLCWGDAVFFDAEPFRVMLDHSVHWDTPAPALVGCCLDESPYAWFDTEGCIIRRSHFRGQDGICSRGLHDQSLFAFHVEQIVSYLERYKNYLGLDRYDPNSYDASRGEMRLLDSFSYFYEQPDLHPVEYRLLPEGRVRSFNTTDELQTVIEELRAFRNVGERHAQDCNFLRRDGKRCTSNGF